MVQRRLKSKNHQWELASSSISAKTVLEDFTEDSHVQPNKLTIRSLTMQSIVSSAYPRTNQSRNNIRDKGGYPLYPE